MKKFVFALMAVMLVAGVALAEKPVLEKPQSPYVPNGRANEVEPNDDFTTANPLVMGDDMSAALDPAGDLDFFSFDATAGMSVTFETLPGDAGDTQLTLLDTDGTTQLGFDDDGGSGLYSLLSFDFTVDGTYFIMINHYSASGTGAYILTATDNNTPAGPGESCATALELVDDGMVNSCPGAEFWYTYTAPFDGMFILDTCIDGQAIDTYIRVYDVCDGTQMASNDDAACDFYNYASYLEVAMTAGTTYVILFDDNWTTSAFDFNFFVSDGVVATDASSFDSLKAMYR